MKKVLIVLLVVGLLVGACSTAAVMSEEESLDEIDFKGEFEGTTGDPSPCGGHGGGDGGHPG